VDFLLRPKMRSKEMALLRKKKRNKAKDNAVA